MLGNAIYKEKISADLQNFSLRERESLFFLNNATKFGVQRINFLKSRFPVLQRKQYASEGLNRKWLNEGDVADGRVFSLCCQTAAAIHFEEC